MTYWQDRGRSCIQTALQSALDEVSVNIRQDQAQQAREIEDLRRDLRVAEQQVQQLDALVTENQALRAALSAWKHASKTSASPSAKHEASSGSGRVPLGEISVNRVLVPSKTKDSAAATPTLTTSPSAHAKLLRTHEATVRSLQKSRSSIARRNVNIEEWRQYARSLERHNEKLLSRLVESNRHTARLDDRHGHRVTAIDANQAVASPRADDSVVVATSEDSTLGSDGQDDLKTATFAYVEPCVARALANHTASTHGDEERRCESGRGVPTIKNEPADADEVEIISEAVVNKPKRKELEFDAVEDFKRVKRESSSDDSRCRDVIIQSSAAESLDLDTVNQDVATPRKSLSSVPVFSTQARVQPRACPILLVAPMKTVNYTQQVALPAATSSYPHEVLTQSDQPKALQRRKADELDRRIDVVSDDQDDGQYLALDKDGAIPLAGRLASLLKGQQADSLPIIRRQNADSRPTSPFPLVGPSLPPPRTLPSKRSISPSRRSHHAHDGVLEESPSLGSRAQQGIVPSVGPSKLALKKSGNLRRKPLADLKPDDFRINPAFNSGNDYAFSEVVRNRSERDALPGCVDPQCCGKEFRSIAEAERRSIGSRNLTRSEDIKLLEDFLGDQAFRLATMSPAERDETWLQAKTREIANRHGRHRHRYTRNASPPGFWDTGFPSTQQRQAEKQAADKAKQQDLQERYQDAMRGGGRWLFRDE